MKKRKLFIGVIIVCVVALVAGGIFLVIKNRQKDSPSSKSAALAKEIDDHDSITLDYNKGKYAAVVTNAAKYAENKGHNTTLRLGMYSLCMQAAFKVKDTQAGDDCHTKGTQLAGTLDTDKDLWVKILDAAQKGETVKDDSDVSQ